MIGNGFQCDQCEKREVVGGHRLTSDPRFDLPAGWLSVAYAKDIAHQDGIYDFCSWACLRAYGAGQMAAAELDEATS